jgi:uncharacterized membrane protein
MSLRDRIDPIRWLGYFWFVAFVAMIAWIVVQEF